MMEHKSKRVGPALLARTTGNGMAATFGRESRSRAVLAAIVADPAFGPAALSNPATLFSLLTEYLPGSPPEKGLLLAAAQVDVPGAVRDYVAGGMSRGMAIQLAAGRLAARTSFPDQACLWAASEFALALGLASADDQLPDWLWPADVTATRSVEPEMGAADGAELLSAGDPAPPGLRGPRRMLAAIMGAVAIAAGATGVALLSHGHETGLRHPYASHRHGNPATRAISARPSAASARPRRASAHRSERATASSVPATPSPRPSSTGPAPAGPELIAREYVAEVNKRDWPSLWQLGGGNIVLTYDPNPGPLTYPEMVARFRHTVWASITSLTRVGDTVSMHVSALDSAGVTQFYKINLVIGHGRIVSGSQYYLGP
jgi:hypothetical protein